MTSLAALFLAAFLAATLLPLASEVPLALLVRSRGDIAWPVIVATVGNALGACTTYALARGLLARRVARSAPDHPRAAAWLARYGAVTLLLSWMPVIGDALVAGAGATRMPFWQFGVWMVAGKAARYLFVAWLAAAA